MKKPAPRNTRKSSAEPTPTPKPKRPAAPAERAPGPLFEGSPAPATPGRRQAAEARTIVIKMGTAVLTGGANELESAWMHDLAMHIAALHEAGRRVILVSSGAIGAGVGVLKLGGRPTDVPALQAAAAAGQPRLMSMWEQAFAVRRLRVAQILLSRTDFDSRQRFLNIRNCVRQLHEFGVIPIVNENDTVATEEISLGDNDVLGAKIAVAAQAEALVILTSVGGVLDEAGQVITEAERPEDLMGHIRAEKSKQGRGGMKTKIEASRIAGGGGVVTVIAPGRPRIVLDAILRGEPIGTCIGVEPARAAAAGRRGWIALAATPAGAVDVDEGAAAALRERGASLLAKGIVGVTGRFEAGDVVQVRDLSGREVARGLTNLSADEVRAVLGKDSAKFEAVLGRRAHEEVIHRDNLAITERS